MLRLTLLCHGATAANRAAGFPADEPLEPQAVAAAHAMRDRLVVKQVLTSPALRARQTVEALGLVASEDTALRDLDYGLWAGLGMDAVLAREPEAFAAFMTDPYARAPDGESVADLCARTAPWIDALLPSSGHVLAITHVAVVRCVVLGVLAAPLEAFWRVDVPPLSTTEFVSDGHRWAWRAARSSNRAGPP